MTLPADQNNERDKRSARQNPFPSTPISHSSPVSTTTPISLARSLIYNISSMIENESDESLAHRLQFQEHVVAASKYINERRSGEKARALAMESRITEQDASTEAALVDGNFSRQLVKELYDQELAINSHKRDDINSSSSMSKNNLESDHITAIHLQMKETNFNSEARVNLNCGKVRLFNAFIMSCILLIGGFIAFLFGPALWEKSGGSRSDLPGFFNDKWSTNDDKNFNGNYSRWKSEGSGLNLTIVNALTSNWDTNFNKAISSWNETDALFLKTTIDYSPNCDIEPGIIKVCNDFFGHTGWTGLNEVYFVGGYIVKSVAKMNESYLKDSSDGEKQYVMCHEIGHGLGLPHRDESAINKDLGSCLDYTMNQEDNQSPDDIDFKNLIALYGTKYRKGSRNLSSKQVENNINTILRQAQQAKDPTYKDGTRLYASKNIEVYEHILHNDVTILTSLLLKK